MDKMYRIIPVFVLCLCALTSAVYESCPSPKGQADVSSIAVLNCHRDEKYCVLKRNTNVTIEFNFSVVEPVTKAVADVHGIVMGLPVPFPLPDNDVCAVTGIQCPLQPGQSIHYKATLPVLKAYPRVQVDVQWELKNENGVSLACILIPVKIK